MSIEDEEIMKFKDCCLNSSSYSKHLRMIYIVEEHVYL